MEKDEIIRFIAEWQNRILRIHGIDREYLHALQETIGSRPIKIITGFRRSGKSFFYCSDKICLDNFTNLVLYFCVICGLKIIAYAKFKVTYTIISSISGYNNYKNTFRRISVRLKDSF